MPLTVEQRLAALERAIFGREQTGDWIQPIDQPAGLPGAPKEPPVWNGAKVTIRSEDASPLVASAVLLDTGYRAALDVRKTTNVAAEVPGPGGSAGLYVQHRASGRASKGVLTSALRAQMETVQGRFTGDVNDSCGIYATIYNAGQDCGGFGVHADATHAAVGPNATTYGMSAELYRAAAHGATVGVHVRTMGWPGMANDVGVLVSRGGNIGNYRNARITRAFAAGSDEITGTLECDIGLDTHAATCERAAIMIGAGQVVELAGLSKAAGLRFDPATRRVQLRSGGAPILEVDVDEPALYFNGKRIDHGG